MLQCIGKGGKRNCCGASRVNFPTEHWRYSLRSLCEQIVDFGSANSLNQDPDASQLALLRLLNEHPNLSQRELSQALGLSLGKTHYLLHALLNKGLVKVQNFKRNDNKLAYAYLLTPAGLGAKLALTRSFLARKEAEFKALQATISALRSEVG